MDFKSYSQGYHPQGFRIHFNWQGKQRLRSNRYVCMTLRGGRRPSCCVGALKPFHSMVNGDIWICSHLVISTCQLVSSSWSLFISQIPPLMRDVLYLTAVLNRSYILYTVLNRNMNIEIQFELIHTLSFDWGNCHSCINPIIYGVYYFSERNSAMTGQGNNHRWSSTEQELQLSCSRGLMYTASLLTSRGANGQTRLSSILYRDRVVSG